MHTCNIYGAGAQQYKCKGLPLVNGALFITTMAAMAAML